MTNSRKHLKPRPPRTFHPYISPSVTPKHQQNTLNAPLLRSTRLPWSTILLPSPPGPAPHAEQGIGFTGPQRHARAAPGRPPPAPAAAKAASRGGGGSGAPGASNREARRGVGEEGGGGGHCLGGGSMRNPIRGWKCRKTGYKDIW